MERKSEYFTGLSAASRLRYEQKVINSGLQIDPYTIEDWLEAPEIIPSIKWSDMILYMTATPSQFTRESIKAWKGMLDGGSFMRAGWVHDLKLHPFTTLGGGGDTRKFVIMGKVKHSQRMSADFLLPWIIAKQDGEITAAHCTCMAGLGEACSHIAAVLSCIINANEMRSRSGVDSCTSNLCAWNHAVNEVKPAYLVDIKFHGQGSRKRLTSDSSCEQPHKTVCHRSPLSPTISSSHLSTLSYEPSGLSSSSTLSYQSPSLSTSLSSPSTSLSSQSTSLSIQSASLPSHGQSTSLSSQSTSLSSQSTPLSSQSTSLSSQSTSLSSQSTSISSQSTSLSTLSSSLPIMSTILSRQSTSLFTPSTLLSSQSTSLSSQSTSLSTPSTSLSSQSTSLSSQSTSLSTLSSSLPIMSTTLSRQSTSLFTPSTLLSSQSTSLSSQSTSLSTPSTSLSSQSTSLSSQSTSLSTLSSSLPIMSTTLSRQSTSLFTPSTLLFSQSTSLSSQSTSLSTPSTSLSSQSSLSTLSSSLPIMSTTLSRQSTSLFTPSTLLSSQSTSLSSQSTSLSTPSTSLSSQSTSLSSQSTSLSTQSTSLFSQSTSFSSQSTSSLSSIQSSSDKHTETPEEDQENFFAKLNTAKNKPAILKIVHPYLEQFIPKTLQPSFPKLISDLYKPSTLLMKYPELLQECDKAFNSYKVTKEQSEVLEANTKDQSSSRLWFMHRVGRITASHFKSAVRTDPCMPSQSLIKRICYPESYKFSTVSTRWGCNHEQEAKDCYLAKASQSHQNLSITEAGLFVDHQNPYLGASPDGLVECCCCGKGVLEVKCPFCHKDSLPEDNETGFCMLKSEGAWSLKRSHSYYYQVQLQLHVCHDALYADFIVWTQSEIAVERIYRDDQFFENCIENARHFFTYGILPEIIGKWYTRMPVAEKDGTIPIPATVDNSDSKVNDDDDDDDIGRCWCYCDQPSFGDMIMCDNKQCAICWFHFDCLRIRTPPKGKWYCPSCRKLKKFSKQKKK